jgi:hypothetical protein
MAKFAGGLLPTLLSGGLGKENRGFGLGLIPGLLYKDSYKDKEEEERRAAEAASVAESTASGMKRGGKVKKMAKGGSVSSASKRADGIAQRGKTKGRFV